MRSNYRNAALWALASSFSVLLAGQELQELGTDLSDPTILVGHKALQIENGFSFTNANRTWTASAGETTIRYGIGSNTEIRLGAPSYIAHIYDADRPAGMTDVSFGVRRRVGPLAITTGMVIPTGDKYNSSRSYDPFVSVPWSHEIGERWTLGGTQSVYWDRDDVPYTIGESSVYFERKLRPNWTTYAEYKASYSEIEPCAHFVHFGGAVRINAAHQIDYGVGFGLTANAPAVYFSMSHSFRINSFTPLNWMGSGRATSGTRQVAQRGG